MPQTISAKRIESDVHLKVTLQDSGVSIAWDSVDIKQVCMYSVEQHAFAGHCSCSVSEEDNKILLVTYPASEQLYTGDYRIVARLVLDGDEHTYDALAFTLKALTDESGSITTEDVEVGIQVEEVNTTIMYEILTACQAATDSALAAEAAIEEAEAARVAAENLRVQAENAREAAEAARVQAEQLRVSAEASREDAEAARVQAESARVTAENLRVAAETARVEAESARVTAENAREAAEAARVQAESARVSAEQGRVSAEAARVQAENAREAAEAARVQAESARVAAEQARVSAEAARVQQASSDHTRAEADHTTTEAAAAQAIAAAQAADAAREAIAGELARKANIDGDYEQMSVGAAKNLKGQIASSGTFLTRTAGGDADFGDGPAKLMGIGGNSVAWLQKIANGNFASISYWTTAGFYGGSYAVADNEMTITPSSGSTNADIKQILGAPVIPGHKYMIAFNLNGTLGGGTVSGRTAGVANENFAFEVSTFNTTKRRKYAIFTAANANNSMLLFFTSLTAGTTIKMSKFVFLDLTQANIDNLTTGAQVEAWLSKNVGLKGYYPRIGGHILSVKMASIKSVGRNLCKVTNNVGTAILPTYTYGDVVNKFGIAGDYTALSFTDCLGNTITPVPDANGIFQIDHEGTLTVTGANAANTYVWAVWDGSMDGAENFKPYTEDQRVIDVTKITGVPEGGTEADRVTVFPYGMGKVGTLQDFIGYVNGSIVANVNVGKIDLSSRNYAYRTTGSGTAEGTTPYFSSSIPGMKRSTSNVLCGRYQYKMSGDKRLQTAEWYSQREINIWDSSYSDVSSFISSLSGIMLFFELETPLTYTDLQDENGEPITLGSIQADNWGIEIIEPQNEEGEPMEICAPTVDIIYPMNAVEVIKTVQDDGIFTAELRANLQGLVSLVNEKLGTAMGGTISISDVPTDKVFSYTFTPSAEPANNEE